MNGIFLAESSVILGRFLPKSRAFTNERTVLWVMTSAKTRQPYSEYRIDHFVTSTSRHHCPTTNYYLCQSFEEISRFVFLYCIAGVSWLNYTYEINYELENWK